jgi:hypothetical protein
VTIAPLLRTNRGETSGQAGTDTGRECQACAGRALRSGGTVQQIPALSRCAVIARHWFEIDLDDASMEDGALTELRELVRACVVKGVSGTDR